MFIDIDRIPYGEDWVEHIESTLSRCDILLALIGRHWLTVTDNRGQRRIDDPEDFLRREISSALHRRDVRVIPVRLGGAEVPRGEELPEELAALPRRQAYRIDDDRWRRDVQDLVHVLAGFREKKAALGEVAPVEREEARQDAEKVLEEDREEAVDKQRRPAKTIPAKTPREQVPSAMPTSVPPPLEAEPRPRSDREPVEAGEWIGARWPELVATAGSLLALLAAFRPFVGSLPLVDRTQIDSSAWWKEESLFAGSALLPPLLCVVGVWLARSRSTVRFLSGALVGLTAMYLLVLLTYALFAVVHDLDLRQGAQLGLVGAGLAFTGTLARALSLPPDELTLLHARAPIAAVLAGACLMAVPVWSLQRSLPLPDDWGIALSIWPLGAVMVALGVLVAVTRRSTRTRQLTGVLTGIGIVAFLQSLGWLGAFIGYWTHDWQVAPLPDAVLEDRLLVILCGLAGAALLVVGGIRALVAMEPVGERSVEPSARASLSGWGRALAAFGALGGLVALAGAVSPWARTDEAVDYKFTFTTSYRFWIGFCSIAAVLAFAAIFRGKSSTLPWVAALSSILTALLATVCFFKVRSAAQEWDYLASIGPGAWLALGGSLCLLVGAVATLLIARRTN